MSEREEVKICRYDACEMDYIAERENGDYVKYEDYIAQLTTAERERDEARREREALKERNALVMKCPVCDDRKAHAHCVHELRHRAERMERVVEAARKWRELEQLWDELASADVVTRQEHNVRFRADVALNELRVAVRALDAAPTRGSDE